MASVQEKMTKEVVEPNYCFVLAKEDAYDRAVKLGFADPDQFAYGGLEGPAAFYDADSPAKETYLLMYTKPIIYYLTKFAGLIFGLSSFTNPRADGILCSYWRKYISHEFFHQMVDEFAGEHPRTNREMHSMEAIITAIESMDAPAYMKAVSGALDRIFGTHEPQCIIDID